MRWKSLLILMALALSGCNLPSATATALPTAGSPSETVPAPSATLAPSQTASNTPDASFTPSPSPSATAAPTQTETPTAAPTYVKLRGVVTIAQAVCHYGPGAPYLYKYGVYEGSNLEILAIDEIGVYVEIQAIGGSNPCWVKAEYMKIKGDLKDLQPILTVDVKLPESPYYGPLTGVSARRDGNTVTVFWHPLVLRAGDDSLQTPYIVEAWVCQNGQLRFKPFGSGQTAVQIPDEPGCTEPSHARVTAAEKHGYTAFVEVPWPAASAGDTPSATPAP
jgi:hypothetical protein